MSVIIPVKTNIPYFLRFVYTKKFGFLRIISRSLTDKIDSLLAIDSITSATLHSYKIRLWLNYDHGKKQDTLQPESSLLSGNRQKERNVMSNSNNNRINVPQAKQAMEQFKMQAASEVGVNLTNGYNGHLTSREAGSVGGQMVKKMIEAYEQGLQ